MLKKFILSEEGYFSITKPYESIQILEIVKHFIDENLSDLVITDGTACMGGDLVRLSKNCRSINGVELEKTNYDCLVKNCEIFGCSNVTLYNDDYTKIFKSIEQDIIYLDPPWGGTDYKKKESVELRMTSLSVAEFLNALKHFAKYIFIKVPMNACLDGIDYDLESIVFNKQRDKSFKLICIRT